MLVAVKIVLCNQIADFFPCRVIEQQTTEQGLFGLQRMRRNTQLGNGGVLGKRGIGILGLGKFLHACILHCGRGTPTRSGNGGRQRKSPASLRSRGFRSGPQP